MSEHLSTPPSLSSQAALWCVVWGVCAVHVCTLTGPSAVHVCSTCVSAVKVQVQQRLAEIDPLAPAKEQSRQIQNIVRQNPSVLGDMATVRNINMMYEPINRELSAQQGREASQFQAKISTAASLANKGVYKPELLKSISSGKEFDAFLQGAAQASKEIS